MPGSSLWLTPPPSHPLHGIIITLIESTIPDLLSKPEPNTSAPHPPIFAPHLTLTSNIDPAVYGSDPQGWLDALPFALPLLRPGSGSDGPARVLFERVKSEDVYFRRCYIECSFTDSIRRLAGVARAWGVHGDGEIRREDGVAVLGEQTEKWLEEWKEAFGPHVSLMYGDMPIDEAKLREIEKAVLEAEVALEGSGSDGLNGWEGGDVWLVPTDRDIPEWKPIATRAL